ncbi:MAG: carbamate kinase [Calditrichaceae bacterium]|nr:carbamate kinase [Calditrichaceae bacterium]MBN2707653.1 carbamate kinase [Calditrichaceae bacterium]RQV93178.1 MAG: carbamate kinase [Calditrichota bacterium]
MKRKKRVVVALGGNAITPAGEEGNITQQFLNTRKSMVSVINLLKRGYDVVITHGNGPQVGNALIRVEESRHLVPELPLGIIVGDLEGGMGYMIEQCLQNVMHDMGINRQVATILTQVLVDPDDPSIKNPTKFVGPFFHEEDVPELINHRGWIMKEDKGRGFRRVVPSPAPIGIVPKDIISHLVDSGIIVIAAGGGGIPVYIDHRGWLEGVDAVIDKDLASAVLARDVNADRLLILTGVEKAALNYNTPEQIDLDTMTVKQAQRYLTEGHFPAGSMGPKIQAAINFISDGGSEVIITSTEKITDALDGKAGTKILPD